jgi:hypothetical protein
MLNTVLADYSGVETSVEKKDGKLSYKDQQFSDRKNYVKCPM